MSNDFISGAGHWQTPPTLADALQAARTAGLPAHEASLLLALVSGRNRTAQIAHPEAPLSPEAANRFKKLLADRLTGQPMAYLTGVREFYSLEFRVTPDVLIPRPETELLVDLALERAPPAAPGHLLDLGTGSGIIAISLSCQRPDLAMTAVDISAAALAVAAQNNTRLGGHVQFLQSDWYSALPQGLRFDLIMSNPPYIPAGDPHLKQGDLRFEPAHALTDAADGLRHLRSIIQGAPACLQPDGWLLFEHGYDQAPACRQLLAAAGFSQIQSWPDLAGIERVSGGQWLANADSPE